MVDGLAGEPLPRVGDLRERQRLRVRAGGQRQVVDDDAEAPLAQRGAHHHAAAGKALADGPGAQRDAGDLRGVHAPGGLPAGSRDAGQRADGASRAVAADHVGGALLGGAVGAGEGDHDALGGLAQRGHLAAAEHRYAELGQPAAQCLLGPGLGQAEHSAVVLVEHAEVEADAAEVPHRAPAELAQPGEQPALAQGFGGPPVEAQGAGFPAGCGQLVVDDHVHPAQAEFPGQHQADRPRADHYDVSCFHIQAFCAVAMVGRCEATQRHVRPQ